MEKKHGKENTILVNFELNLTLTFSTFLNLADVYIIYIVTRLYLKEILNIIGPTRHSV